MQHVKDTISIVNCRSQCYSNDLRRPSKS